MHAAHLLEAAVYGPDLDALERFYVDVLGLAPIARTAGRNVALRCGASVVIVFDPGVSGVPGGRIPHHGAAGPGHVAFAVPPAELPAWRARLRAAGVAIETEIAWGEGHVSVYFRDPAGNSVELAPPTLWDLLGDAAREPERRDGGG